MYRKLISHRGNLDGPNKTTENTLDQIDKAIADGFCVEIDFWCTERGLFLGHDGPEHEIYWEEITDRKADLFIHCKNPEALAFSDAMFHNDDPLKEFGPYNFFWHQTDQYTLTSAGVVWAFPTAKPLQNCIVAIPEAAYGLQIVHHHIDPNIVWGICTDYPRYFRDKLF